MTTAVFHDALTTVGNWRGYGSIEHGGLHYGQKAHSLRKFFELPKMTTDKFALALAIHPDEKSDVKALRENDWELLDPLACAQTLAPMARPDFYDYIFGGGCIAVDGRLAAVLWVLDND